MYDTELLTAKEHLELYARVKGVAEKDIKIIIAEHCARCGIFTLFRSVNT